VPYLKFCKPTMMSGGDDAAKIFVGGLPKGTTTEQLGAWASQFGPVEKAEVKLDPLGYPRGFGFVSFQGAEVAQAVIANKDNNVMEGKWVDCKPVVQGGGDKGGGKGGGKESGLNDPSNPKLFVGALPRTANEESITAHFSQFGAVKEVVVKMHDDGSCKGFAFVLFEDAGSAKMVLDNHASNEFEGKWIDCKSAVTMPKGGGKGKDGMGMMMGMMGAMMGGWGGKGGGKDWGGSWGGGGKDFGGKGGGMMGGKGGGMMGGKGGGMMGGKGGGMMGGKGGGMMGGGMKGGFGGKDGGKGGYGAMGGGYGAAPSGGKGYSAGPYW